MPHWPLTATADVGLAAGRGLGDEVEGLVAKVLAPKKATGRKNIR